MPTGNHSLSVLGAADHPMEVTEGGLTVEAPDDADGDVFFNPHMELNRDVTVAVLRVAASEWYTDDAPTYLDAMAGIGIRGVRAGAAGYAVTCCDREAAPLAFAERNLDRHDIDGTLVHDDVRRHAYGAHYRVVDLDPFGSPMPYVEAGIDATSGLLCATATDTAPLCGAHLAAGRRRYGANPVTTDYHPEVGLRVLVGAIARVAARADVAVDPVLSHTTRHYHRTYLRLDHRATAADAAIDALGYVIQCRVCAHRDTRHGLAPALPDGCGVCGGDVDRIGPLWLDPYRDPAVVDAVHNAVDDDMGTATRTRRLLARLRAEASIPTHHDHHALCDRLEVPAGPMDGVIDGLRERGFTATRTHFGGTTFKTDAPVDAIHTVVEDVADSA